MSFAVHLHCHKCEEDMDPIEAICPTCWRDGNDEALRAALAEKAQRVEKSERQVDAEKIKASRRIGRVCDQRNEAEAEVARLTAQRDEWKAKADIAALAQQSTDRKRTAQIEAAEQRAERLSGVVEAGRPFFDAWRCDEGSRMWDTELTDYQRRFVRACKALAQSAAEEGSQDPADWMACDLHESTYPRGGACQQCREEEGSADG